MGLGVNVQAQGWDKLLDDDDETMFREVRDHSGVHIFLDGRTTYRVHGIASDNRVENEHEEF